MIKLIRNYFKDDVEIRGRCYYCGKYTEDGSLFLKSSYGDSWSSPRWDKILICHKSRCYYKAREDCSVSMLSKKQRRHCDLLFLLSFILIVMLIFMC